MTPQFGGNGGGERKLPKRKRPGLEEGEGEEGQMGQAPPQGPGGGSRRLPSRPVQSGAAAGPIAPAPPPVEAPVATGPASGAEPPNPMHEGLESPELEALEQSTGVEQSPSTTLLQKLNPAQVGFIDGGRTCANCAYLGEGGQECKVVDVYFDNPEQAVCGIHVPAESGGDEFGGGEVAGAEEAPAIMG